MYLVRGRHAGFTSPGRDDEIRLYFHKELYEVLEKAFDGSGIPWPDASMKTAATVH